MTALEIEYVQDIVEQEGFDYAFRHYTDFKESVKDEGFHALRLAYVKAAEKLAEYAGVEDD